MRQRLGIAAALLGDPPVLMLDEPFNGMAPEGIVWMRGFLASLAAEGRAVLVSAAARLCPDRHRARHPPRSPGRHHLKSRRRLDDPGSP
jgi:ABC-type thiamine transport system ATPase subunit